MSTLVHTLVDAVDTVDGVDATISEFGLYDPAQKVADRGLVVFGTYADGRLYRDSATMKREGTSAAEFDAALLRAATERGLRG